VRGLYFARCFSELVEPTEFETDKAVLLLLPSGENLREVANHLADLLLDRPHSLDGVQKLLYLVGLKDEDHQDALVALPVLDVADREKIPQRLRYPFDALLTELSRVVAQIY